MFCRFESQEEIDAIRASQKLTKFLPAYWTSLRKHEGMWKWTETDTQEASVKPWAQDEPLVGSGGTRTHIDLRVSIFRVAANVSSCALHVLSEKYFYVIAQYSYNICAYIRSKNSGTLSV